MHFELVGVELALHEMDWLPGCCGIGPLFVVLVRRQRIVQGLIVLVWRIQDVHEVSTRVLMLLVNGLQGEVRLVRIHNRHLMLVVRRHRVTWLISWFCNDVFYGGLKGRVRIVKVEIVRLGVLVLPLL